jgi:hypothetical protein
MEKMKPESAKSLRPGRDGKIRKNYRFTPETARKLTIAARKEDVTETAYIETALRIAFRKDGIK